jgi:hypothetical protein
VRVQSRSSAHEYGPSVRSATKTLCSLWRFSDFPRKGISEGEGRTVYGEEGWGGIAHRNKPKHSPQLFSVQGANRIQTVHKQKRQFDTLSMAKLAGAGLHVAGACSGGFVTICNYGTSPALFHQSPDKSLSITHYTLHTYIHWPVTYCIGTLYSLSEARHSFN